MSLAPKIEAALERAFREREAESYATDAAIVAHVLLRYHGDQASHVLKLASEFAKAAA